MKVDPEEKHQGGVRWEEGMHLDAAVPVGNPTRDLVWRTLKRVYLSTHSLHRVHILPEGLHSDLEFIRIAEQILQGLYGLKGRGRGTRIKLVWLKGSQPTAISLRLLVPQGLCWDLHSTG